MLALAFLFSTAFPLKTADLRVLLDGVGSPVSSTEWTLQAVTPQILNPAS